MERMTGDGGKGTVTEKKGVVERFWGSGYGGGTITRMENLVGTTGNLREKKRPGYDKSVKSWGWI